MPNDNVPYVMWSSLGLPVRKDKRINWSSFLLGLITGIGVATAILLWRGVV